MLVPTQQRGWRCALKKWKSILKKILWPGKGWGLLAVLLGGSSLALTYLVFGSHSPFAYASYVLSAYGLTVVIAAVVSLIPSVQQMIYNVPLAHRYMTDRYFQVRSSLLLSFFINLCYAGFKLICAILYISFWDGALAVYNILLCAVRIYLVRRVPTEQQKQNIAKELRYYRTTGYFLVMLDLALSGIATQIVLDGQGSNYPGTMIYAVALFAFYSLTLSIFNTIRFRKFHSPVLSAAKAVNLTTALVSIFNLETAMLTQFNQEDAGFRLIMTACTAFAVCIIVLGMAIFMVCSANRKIRSFSI